MPRNPHADILPRENLRYFLLTIEFDESSGIVRSYCSLRRKLKKPDPFFIRVLSVFHSRTDDIRSVGPLQRKRFSRVDGSPDGFLNSDHPLPIIHSFLRVFID